MIFSKLSKHFSAAQRAKKPLSLIHISQQRESGFLLIPISGPGRSSPGPLLPALSSVRQKTPPSHRQQRFFIEWNGPAARPLRYRLDIPKISTTTNRTQRQPMMISMVRTETWMWS